MTFLDPAWLIGLAALPLLASVLAGAFVLRRRALRRFFGPERGHSGARPWARPAAAWRAAARGAALLIALALVTVALARPATDPQPRRIARAGRDVVFVIDVSRSMLARDIRPNRLERAKLAVRDVLDTVEGDRVAIIAFAGTAVLKCPLTTDYAFARLALDELGPDSVTRGGTAIGSAIRTAVDLLEPPELPGSGRSERGGAAAAGADQARFRDVFIFTDGEDHETDPVAAAQAAGEKGIRIITVGLGSELEGAPVPADDRRSSGAPASPQTEPAPGAVLRYQGEPVRSRLNPEPLRKIAEAGAPGGMFLNVGTGHVELDRIYRRLMRDAERRTLEDARAIRYTELFQVALAGALALLCIEPLLSLGRR